jgi:pimeloyl-ACP methyl ester carboxylesterase
MSISGLQYGDFFGNIPYVRWGTGNKKMIVFPGGPGNTVPSSFMIQNFYHEFDPFTKEYSIYLVSRKKEHPTGYSTRDMSNDYAEIINHDFSGHVDLIIGTSMGGMIAQHFAADYPKLFDHIVIAIAAHKMSDIGKKIDYKFAQLLSQGKTRNAAATIVDALYPPGITAYLYKAVFWLMGGALLGQVHETFKNDVMVEAQAELDHEAKDSLTRIHVPILIIGGTADVYFPREYIEEMAGLVNGSSLKLYEGKGHMGTLEDEAFAKDIFEFIGHEKSKL